MKKEILEKKDKINKLKTEEDFLKKVQIMQMAINLTWSDKDLEKTILTYREIYKEIYG